MLSVRFTRVLLGLPNALLGVVVDLFLARGLVWRLQKVSRVVDNSSTPQPPLQHLSGEVISPPQVIKP